MKLILEAWSQTRKQVGDPVSGNFISFFVRSWISTLPISNQSMSASKYSSDIFESAHILGPVDPTENQLVEYWIKSAIFDKPEWTWTPVLSSLCLLCFCPFFPEITEGCHVWKVTLFIIAWHRREIRDNTSRAQSPLSDGQVPADTLIGQIPK